MRRRSFPLLPSGGVTSRDAPLDRPILQAYGLRPYQLIGAPAWVASSRFDIVARGSGPASLVEINAMLRQLLAARFKLVAHIETREMDVYELKYARADRVLGPGISPTKVDCDAIAAELRKKAAEQPGDQQALAPPPPPGQRPVCSSSFHATQGGGGMVLEFLAGGRDLGLLLSLISGEVGRPVLDRTRLTGRFDFTVRYAPRFANPLQAGLPGGAATTPVDAAPIEQGDPGSRVSARFRTRAGSCARHRQHRASQPRLVGAHRYPRAGELPVQYRGPMAEYSFGPFTVDTTSARLMREGADVRLRPRAFQTLRVLLQHGGESVGYERMIAEAWEGTHVSRHTVDVTVAEVRKSLGEYGRWITHRPKVGYALEIPRSDELVRTGWHFWNQRTREGCERAIDAFSRAIEECRADFRAFEGLSASYLGLAVFGMRPPREMYPRFLDAHGEAVALGGLRPELRCNRAYGLHIFERDLSQAEAEFLRTIEERPTLPSTYVRLARMYGGMKRFDDAIETLHRGFKVDPLLPTLPATEVLVRVWQRDYDQAIALGAKAVELHPYLQVVRVNFGQALVGAGRLQEALAQYQTAAVMSPDLPWLRALQGAVLAKLGRVAEARAILAELEALRCTDYVDAYHMAILRRALGDTELACAETQRAVDDNSAWLFTLDVDPNMDGVRTHPAFKAIS